MNQKIVIKRYSQAFKQQVVKEYEAGSSAPELQKKYGIGSATSIRTWIEQYSHQGTRHKLMVIQRPEEQNQVKVCQQRVSQLEKVVAQLTLDKLMLSASLAEAEVRLGEAVKKNSATQSLPGPTKSTGKPGDR